MADSLLSDEHYRLCILLCQAKDTMLKAREKELKQYGITPEQAMVLFTIQALGEAATPAEISRWMLRRHHTILGILERMERNGLVRKSKDLVRKNLIRITLTEKGQQAYYQSTKLESIHNIILSLSQEQCRQLIPCLEALRDAALKELGNAVAKELGIKQKPPFPPP